MLSDERAEGLRAEVRRLRSGLQKRGAEAPQVKRQRRCFRYIESDAAERVVPGCIRIGCVRIGCVRFEHAKIGGSWG